MVDANRIDALDENIAPEANGDVEVAPVDRFWQDRAVLVTGCAGFLGAHLTHELVTRGARVVGLVRDRVPHSLLYRTGLLDQISTVTGEVRDLPLLERVLAEYEIKTVYHLAAQTIVGVARRSPVGTFEVNVSGTWTLLEAARRTPGIEQVLISSSDKAYGEHAKLPYDENTPLSGRGPYDVSKACADMIAQSYAHTYGLPIGIVRCGNLYGGGDLNWNRIVPGTIRSTLLGERPVIRGDGTATRDYLHISDGVAAYLTLAQRMAESPDLRGLAFNFGSEAPTSVLELVQAILHAAGKDGVQPRILCQETDDIHHQYLNSARAHARLHWAPRYDLAAGLRETVEWYRHHLQIPPGA